MNLSGQPTIIQTIVGCARCRGDGHDKLVFHAFKQYPIEDPNGEFTHWAMCPVMNEPVLLRITPEGGNAEKG